MIKEYVQKNLNRVWLPGSDISKDSVFGSNKIGEVHNEIVCDDKNISINICFTGLQVYIFE